LVNFCTHSLNFFQQATVLPLQGEHGMWQMLNCQTVESFDLPLDNNLLLTTICCSALSVRPDDLQGSFQLQFWANS